MQFLRAHNFVVRQSMISLKTRKRTQSFITIGTPKLGSMSFCRTSRLILRWTRRTNYTVLPALMTGIGLRWIPTHKVSLSETEWCRVKLSTGMVVCSNCSVQLLRRTDDDWQAHFVRLKFQVLADYTVLWGNLETDRGTSFSTIWQYDVYTWSFWCAQCLHIFLHSQSQFMPAVPSCTQLCSSSGYGSLETRKRTQGFLTFATPKLGLMSCWTGWLITSGT